MTVVKNSDFQMLNTPLLDSIETPKDLRLFSLSQLEDLCKELRLELIHTLSSIGGHFASSLGATEITVAVHKVFNTPYDRVVWDTGHQAYMHKILTGRRKELMSVRKLGGICGFPLRSESIYDTFGVGHAGTSISAAAGMLETSSHSYPGSNSRKAVAIIGDGAMTAGMAFEALNHCGQLLRNLVVILNDNEMSIAPNVGALSWAFSKATTGKVSTSARRQVKNLHDKGLIPHSFYRALDRAEEAAQGFFSSPAMLFESFGFKYIGPVDGHSVEQLVSALERAVSQDGPVLVHAHTTKGKGYAQAEENPIKYHGIGPFEIKNGASGKSSGKPSPSYTDVFGKTLVELAQVDKRIVGITAAMPDGTGLKYLAEELPDRYYDVGIAEQHAVTFAAGMACEGMRPFCAIYSTFLQRAYDQVVHDVCIQSLPVIFALDRAGLVGADGATHHGIYDISFLRTLPQMVIMAPKDEAELKDMMLTALLYDKGPVALRYPRGSGPGVDISKAATPLEIGKAEIVRHAGASTHSVVILGLGHTVHTSLEAADILSNESNIECTVVNARFAKPLDNILFSKLIQEHDLIVTIEDHAIQGGFGSAVLELASDQNITPFPRIVRLGIPDNFVEHGTQAELYKICGYDVASIVYRIKSEINLLKPRDFTSAASIRHVG